MENQITTPEMQELSDQIGEFVYYWGFKRIHGKIWTHLFLANRPLDAADLVKQMKISKALVSISLRELMEYEVIHTAGKSARGTQLYKTNPDILQVILTVLRQREKRMLARVQAAHESMQKVAPEEQAKTGVSQIRMLQLGLLIQKAVLGLDGIISLQPVDFGDWQKVFEIPQIDEADMASLAAGLAGDDSSEETMGSQPGRGQSQSHTHHDQLNAQSTEPDIPMMPKGVGQGFN
jgi:DNA-binding transcriptional regulator GbsR (MarR family)